jgi:hypothetical protein
MNTFNVYEKRDFILKRIKDKPREIFSIYKVAEELGINHNEVLDLVRYLECEDEFINCDIQDHYYITTKGEMFLFEGGYKAVKNNKSNTNRKKITELPNFKDLFFKPEYAEIYLKILAELDPPYIDGLNNYIGKNKGIFPLWVKVLKNHKPEPLIKHFDDIVYKEILNQKVNGLNLSKDASEFRKQYVRLENSKTELNIKTILSQYSQSGKLGK